MNVYRFFLSLLSLALLASCGQPSAPTSAGVGGAPVDEASGSGSRDFGDYVLHYNALSTDQLPPEVAKGYSIVRSKNRALLNISIIKKKEGTPGTPVAGSVSAHATNLTGQLKNLTLRQVSDGDAVYYIGELPVANGETLIFDVSATPLNESSRFNVKFKRQFFTD